MRVKTDADLLAAIADFRRALPGWWFSLGDCSVSCDASCGPDSAGPDAGLLANRLFDEGFHADLRQPSSMADALQDVQMQALQAKARTEARRLALADGVEQRGSTSTTGGDAVPGTDHNPPDLGPARV